MMPLFWTFSSAPSCHRPPAVRAVLGALLVPLGVLALLGLAGCGDAEGPPVAELAVEPLELTLPHSSFREVRLDWSLVSELEGMREPVRVFVHLLDEEGRLTRTFDHVLPGGWETGAERTDPVRIYQSALAPPLPPGDYGLSVGLYDAEGTRWPIDVEGERVGEGEYVVARVTVPAEPADVPAIGFSRSWSPTYAGSDRQVLAVRWLTGAGTIRLEEVPGPGRLWLQIRIPPEGIEGARRVFRGGEEMEDVPGVRVAAPCSGFEAFVSGEGTHRVEVPVASEEGECVVRMEPSYAMVSQGMEQQTVLLENIAWRGEG